MGAGMISERSDSSTSTNSDFKAIPNQSSFVLSETRACVGRGPFQPEIFDSAGLAGPCYVGNRQDTVSEERTY